MARFNALIRNTWGLWIIFFLTASVLSYFDRIFLVSFPLCTIVFFWFAFIRYDEDGNFKGS